jgi:hypothetical protein
MSEPYGDIFAPDPPKPEPPGSGNPKPDEPKKLPKKLPKLPLPKGYPEIPFIPYVVAVVVVASPIEFFKMTGQDEWVWKYVFLICLMLIVYYWAGLAEFADYMNGL